VWSALVTAIGGTLGVIWAIHPGWRPGSSKGPGPAAEIKVAAIDQRVAFGRFLTEHRRPINALSLRERCVPGNVYYVQEKLSDVGNHTISLSVVLYNATTGSRVSFFNYHPSFQQGRAATGGQIIPIWTEWPARGGTYFARIFLSRDGSDLALVNAPRFRLRTDQIYKALALCLLGES
jgi:hypothetical protein